MHPGEYLLDIRCACDDKCVGDITYVASSISSFWMCWDFKPWAFVRGDVCPFPYIQNTTTTNTYRVVPFTKAVLTNRPNGVITVVSVSQPLTVHYLNCW